ncbi:hypothetical protein MASR2M70_20040 [Bacillota bacterium]
MRNLRKRISLTLVTVLIIGAFSSYTAFADSLGDKLDGKAITIGEKTVLANGVYWNSGYNDKITENFIEYVPDGSIVPIITHGNDIYGAAGFKAVAAKAAMEGKYVVAGLNGDFFNMNNGVPVGATIKDGLLLSSESLYNPTAGFFADGKAIIGRPNINVRLDGIALGAGIGSMHLNKAVTAASGVMLYTRDYSDDDTNKAAIPTYNILISVDTEEIRINGTVNAVVESAYNAVGAAAIPQGRMLLTMASGTNYPGTLSKLMALVPGEQLTITFAADPLWNDVTFAVGGGEKLITGGSIAAFANAEIHPRTAMGIRPDGSVIFYTVDGRQAGHSKGATLSQLAARLLELGCTEAVNLDGGGSTAIHALYPGDKSIVNINSPSQSTLRNCANYILLINNASPSDRLGNVHIYPYSLKMLAGSSRKFEVKGTDVNYYPLELTKGVTFSSPKSLGTFDQDNTFTAGSNNSTGVITAESGGARGTAEITVVSKPDSIALINQADGKVIANAAITAGEQVDLSVSALYKRMPLYSDDKCYTWTVEGNIGAIDENGIFTAANISSGSGLIKASVGGISASATVNITSEGWRLETFENESHGLQGGTDGISLGINTDLTRVRYGLKSARLDYDFGAAGADELVLPTTIAFAKSPGSINFWVYGDGSGNTLNLTVNTPEGKKDIVGTKLDYIGWKITALMLPKGSTSLAAFKLQKTGSGTGTIYLDQLIAGIGYYVDQDPPLVQAAINGQILTALISDGGDSRISSSKISLTYDGKALEYVYNQENKTLTATLPTGDGNMHRIALVVTDESGNLTRTGLTIPPGAEAPQPFIDMTGHWALGNTAYLYNRGVVNGVNTDHGLVYNPDKSITRAEFAVLMKNWMGDKAAGYGNTELPFVDKDAIPAWALEAVKAMYGMKIIMGTGTEKGLVFNPLGPISRQEVMTIIGRTQIRGFAEGSISGFTDGGDVADWALPYVKTLVNQQVVSGYEGRIWPKNPVTRAQVATIITILY